MTDTRSISDAAGLETAGILASCLDESAEAAADAAAAEARAETIPAGIFAAILGSGHLIGTARLRPRGSAIVRVDAVRHPGGALAWRVRRRAGSMAWSDVCELPVDHGETWEDLASRVAESLGARRVTWDWSLPEDSPASSWYAPDYDDDPLVLAEEWRQANNSGW